MSLDDECTMEIEDILNAINDGILTKEEADGMLSKVGKENLVPKSYSPDARMPNLTQFNPIQVGPRGGCKMDMSEMQRFLVACHVCYDNRWLQYDGRIYSPISERDVDRLVYDCCQNAVVGGIEYVPQNNEMNSLIRYLKTKLNPQDVVGFPQGMEDVAQQYDTSDGSYNIVFRNGILHVKGAEKTLLDFTPCVFRTNMVNADYRPYVSDDSEIMRILLNILPDQDTLEFFYEMVGYILYSETMNPPAIFLLYGPGNTGKTALHQMIARVVGEQNVSTLGLSQITSRFGTAELNGKLLNVCGETGGASRRQTGVDGELLKKLTDGQMVTVEEKNKSPFQMRNTAKLLFVSNTPPDFGDDSSGMRRRMYTILCNKPQDPTLDIYTPLTSEETSTWLAMRSLDAYNRFVSRKHVFSVSPSMKEENTMQSLQNPIIAFFQDIFGTSDANDVRMMILADSELYVVQNLYARYKSWCINNGIPPYAVISQHKFTSRVRTDFYMSLRVKRVPDGLNGTKPVRVYTMPEYEIRAGEEDMEEVEE